MRVAYPTPYRGRTPQGGAAAASRLKTSESYRTVSIEAARHPGSSDLLEAVGQRLEGAAPLIASRCESLRPALLHADWNHRPSSD